MTLRPKISPRERILTFSTFGAGKSNALLTIARKCPTDTFHVLDNDFAYERLLATDFADLSNVHVTNCDEWQDYIPTIKRIGGDMGRDDWLVLDSTTATWDAVQGWFVEQIHGESIEEYFMEVRAKKAANRNSDKKSLGALEGWMDWPVINKQYVRLYNALLNVTGHLYLTAELTVLGSESDEDRETKALFGPHGVKPKGQKRLGHIPHTVLLLSKSRTGEYRMTTVKDRGRREVEQEPVTDFSKDYLMRLGGWRPTTNGTERA